MAPGALDAEDLSYTLKGVIVHISPYSQAGHYVAFVKCRGQWFRCDDSVITEEKEHVVLSQNVYMVIYERNRVQDHTQKCTDAEFKAKADRAEPAGPDESPSEESGGEAGMVAGEVAPSASTAASEVADGGAAIQVVGEEGSEVGGGVTLAQQREREPEYTLEERADAKTGRRVLHLHIRLPAVSSQKELDVKFGLHRVVLVAEGKYRLDLSVQAKEKVPIKCRFVKKTKTLKIAFEA